MIAIGIVIHSNMIDKRDFSEEPDKFGLLLDLIRTIDMFTPQEYVLIIRDNNSLDYRFQNFNVTLKKLFSHMNIMFLNSEVNELTHAWNQLIDIGLNDLNCEAITILNQDIILTKYWENFTNAITIQSRNIFSPRTDKMQYQPLQQVDEEDFEPDSALLWVPTVQGFCWGASKNSLEENMYDSTHYFDPEIQWEYNEEEWQLRNNATGGKSLVVMNSFVIHIDEATWAARGLFSTKQPKNLYKKEYRESSLGIIDYEAYLKGTIT